MGSSLNCHDAHSKLGRVVLASHVALVVFVVFVVFVKIVVFVVFVGPRRLGTIVLVAVPPNCRTRAARVIEPSALLGVTVGAGGDGAGQS